MFGQRCPTVVPTMQTSSDHVVMKIEPNHRIWLKLTLSALIPLMIGVFTIVTTLLQQKLSLQQRQQDKQDSLLLRIQSDRLAENLQKESVLVTYLNDVSKLLMSEDNSKIFIHIRTKTLTSLRQLDSDRKRYLLLFLYESELITYEAQQNLSSLLKLNGADFNGIQFNGTNMNKCSFVRLYLHDIYLSNSSFINCYIDRSNFSYATMFNSMFTTGVLIRTSFKFALLDKSHFNYIRLSAMNFSGASLIGCNFTGAMFVKDAVDFTNADLTDAIMSNEQLNNATLDNSILPNGTWGPIRKENLVVNGYLEKQCSSNYGNTLNGWIISFDGDIRVFRNENPNISECYFRTTSFNNFKNFAFLSQIISLENYTRLVSASNARYYASATFQCFGLQYATMRIQLIDVNGLRDFGVYNETAHGRYDIQTLEISNNLRSDIRSIRILITIFRSYDLNHSNATIEGNYCACYNVKLSIIKNN